MTNSAPLDGPTGTARRFAVARAVVALMLREIATRYAGSPGGFAWALIEPLAGILILSVGFALVMRSPPLGHDFLLYYATGYLPYIAFQRVSGMVARSVTFSRPLLAYPAVTWVDAHLARFLLNAITSLLVGIIILVGVVALTDTIVIISPGPIVVSTLLALLLALAVGMFNSALGGLFPVWFTIYGILTRPLVLMSGVIFLFETMPPLARDILWYNPLIQIVGLARRGYYPHYYADYVSVTYVTAVALLALFFGVLLMRRYHRDILEG